MKPATDSIIIYQGSYDVRRYRWMRDGVPVDLTGASIAVQFRRNPRAALSYEMTTENGLVVIDGDGWFRLIFKSASTMAVDIVEQTRLLGHVNVALAGQDPVRLVELTAQFNPTVTRND